MRKINPNSISNFEKGNFSIMTLFKYSCCHFIFLAILFFSKVLKSGFEYELNGILWEEDKI